MNTEVLISEVAKLPTPFGVFNVQAFKEGCKEHLAIFTPTLCDNPIVRVHSECLTGDVLGSLKCDCGSQLNRALEVIAKEECGIILYLRQEGRNIGLLNKINAYALQDTGLDTVAANHQLGFADDERTYEIAEFMLEYLGVKQMRLLTNNPKKLESFSMIGITERIPLIVEANDYNRNYLQTKKIKSGHLL